MQKTLIGFCAIALSLFAQDGEPVRLVYPWLSHNAQFESILFINNHEVTDQNVSLVAYRGQQATDSNLSTTAEITIPGRSFVRMDMSQLFPALGEGSGFSVIAELPTPSFTGGWLTYNLQTGTGKSPSMGNAILLPYDEALPAQPDLGHEILFPFLPISDGLTSAPVLVQVGAEPIEATITIIDASGSVAGETSLPALEPFKPFAILANQLVPEGTQGPLYAIASSESNLVGAAFVFNEAAEPSIGNALNRELFVPGDQVLLPWVSDNTQFESILFAINLTDDELNLTLDAKRGDGASATKSISLSSGAMLHQTATQLFPTLEGGSGYSVTITGDREAFHAGWVTNNLETSTGKSPSQGSGIRIPKGNAETHELGKNLVFRLLPLENGFTSAPVILHTDAAPQDIRLYFFDKAGTRIAEKLLTQVPPHQPFAQVANQLVPNQQDVMMVAMANVPMAGAFFIFNSGSEPSIGNASRVMPGVPPNFDLIAEAQIGTAGGTLVSDDFELVVPSGSFNATAALQIYAGQLFDIQDQPLVGSMLKGMPETYQTALTWRTRIPDGEDVNEVAMFVGESSFTPTLGTEHVSYSAFPVSVNGQWMETSLPPISEPVSKRNTPTEPVQPRMVPVFGVPTYFTPEGHFMITNGDDVIAPLDLIVDLGGHLEEAYNTLKGMGFDFSKRTNWPVSVTVRRLESGTYGVYCNSYFGSNYGYIEFNFLHLDEPDELRTTAGHEFYHLIQYLYDNRGAYDKKKFPRDSYWFDEAGGSWIEEKFTEQTNYVPGPYVGNMKEVLTGFQAGAKYGHQNHGYGLTILTKYINEHLPESVNLLIYERILEGDHIIQILDELAPAKDRLDWYKEFFRSFVDQTHYPVAPSFLLGQRDKTIILTQDNQQFFRQSRIGDLGSAIQAVVINSDTFSNITQLDINMEGANVLADPNEDVTMDIYLYGNTLTSLAEDTAEYNIKNLNDFIMQNPNPKLLMVIHNPRLKFPYDGSRIFTTEVKTVERQARFTLRNSDSNDQPENIHILMPWESFEASNRLTPGANRSVETTNYKEGDELQIRAGRNGTVLATATCTLTSEIYYGEIVWNGNSISCSAVDPP